MYIRTNTRWKLLLTCGKIYGIIPDGTQSTIDGNFPDGKSDEIKKDYSKSSSLLL